MKKRCYFLMLASAILIAGCGASRDQEARKLINQFYQAHQANPPSGALTLQELVLFRPFLSVPLFDLLKDVSVIEESRQAQAGEAMPPLLDGDPFTTLSKGASTYHLRACDISEDRGICTVELIYSDPQLPPPFKWTDRLHLQRDGRGWVIDNIEYGGGKRRGDLRNNLQAIRDNSGPRRP